MSEYWVAHKKYFCKYCNIYIADDVPSRRQHETGLRHKGNVERFVRGLYKEGERRKHDLEEEKRDMARVEQAAEAAYARDVGAGLVKPGSSSASAAARSAPEAKKPVPRPSNPYADYTTAANLGITDPDEERRQAEAERRRTQGVAGDWEFMSIVDPAAPVGEGAGHAVVVTPEAGPSAGMKREAEAIPEFEDTRTFKLRRKTVGVGLGDIYDPGLIPIKVKKETASESLSVVSAEGRPAGFTSSAASTTNGSASTEKPSWSARGWNRPGEGKADEPSTTKTGNPTYTSPEPTTSREATTHALEPPPVPVEASKGSLQTTEDTATKVQMTTETPPVKVEPEADSAAAAIPAGGSMFRKRKLPAGGATRGRRS